MLPSSVVCRLDLRATIGYFSSASRSELHLFARFVRVPASVTICPIRADRSKLATSDHYAVAADSSGVMQMATTVADEATQYGIDGNRTTATGTELWRLP